MTPHEPNGLKLGFASVVSKGNQVVRLPVVKGVNTEIGNQDDTGCYRCTRVHP
jgi:hypothetical protein